MKPGLFILIIVTTCATLKLHAQQDHHFIRSLDYSLRVNYGELVPHKPHLRYLVRGHISAYDFYISKTVQGDKPWHHSYRLPTLGLGYSFAGLNLPDTLGSLHTLYGLIDIPLIKKGNFSLSYEFQGGLGYLTHPFDRKENYFNVAIGSHLNVYANLGLNLSYHFQSFEFQLGTNFRHISNTAYQVPNLGLNFIYLNGAIKYLPSKSGKQTRLKPDSYRANNLHVIFSGGRKEIAIYEDKYSTCGLSLDFERQVSHSKLFALGTDLFYDASIEREREILLINDDARNVNFRMGFHIGYGIVFGKTTFIVQLGTYLKQKIPEASKYYNRIGFKINLSERIKLNLTLKSHKYVADTMEIGIGYNIFNQIKK